MPTQSHALVCDVDEPSRKLVRYYLEKDGFLITEVENASRLALVSLTDVSIILMDSRFPSGDATEIVSQLRVRAPAIPIVIFSARASIRECVRFLKEGAYWFIEKPFDPEELRGRVQEACSSSNQVGSTQTSLPSKLNGNETEWLSPAMRVVVERAHKVASLSSTILLSGESGTGKSQLARTIHENGPRKEKPFISLSCAAIPGELLESELFGHEKGAFTGAVTTRHGAIELAEGGTLFLDEIGDLPLELQPKLLTFLQERKFRRVGGAKEVSANVRIIAASHFDLRELCKEKRFRDDLYYRLHVIDLCLPPLRRRKDDILPLAQEILKRIANSRGTTLIGLSSEAKQSLLSYPWPGNIRELENILERSTAFVDGSLLTSQDLELLSETTAPLAEGDELPKHSNPGSETVIFTLAGRTLDEIERDALIQTLHACKWNKTMAAAQLGISIKSIYNKMERLSISDPAASSRERV